MGIFKKDELLLDFNGLRTENISSTIPYMNRLNADVNTLIGHINPTNNKSMRLFTESENHNMYKLFEQAPNVNNNDNNFSETSPFISSDVYNNLIKTQKGGARDFDDSTSSDDNNDSELSSKKSSKKSKKSSKKSSKKIEDESFNSENDYDDDDDEEVEEVISRSSMSMGSYLSSSAHTDGVNSSSASASVSTVSLKNKHRGLSDSINTSDINIISVDS